MRRTGLTRYHDVGAEERWRQELHGLRAGATADEDDPLRRDAERPHGVGQQQSRPSTAALATSAGSVVDVTPLNTAVAAGRLGVRSPSR